MNGPNRSFSEILFVDKNDTHLYFYILDLQIIRLDRLDR